MDAESAIRIISALANGVDPHTGEVMQAEGPFQNPNTVRALFLAIKGLELMERKEKRSNRLPTNAGKPWTIMEDEELANEYDAGTKIKELSERHGRTVGAIQSRLTKLGKIDSEVTNNLPSNPWTTEEDEHQ